MNCSSCKTANPDGARFCFNCGTPLATSCAHCGATLPTGAKFCANCGHELGVASQTAPSPTTAAPIPLSSAPPLPAAADHAGGLQQFIPRELLAKLEAAQGRGGIEGERRIVTMLFCDAKGSTAAAGQLDPEDWAEIINGAFEHMIKPVYRYEGTVARLMGDGILAFFGAPIAHEDDPQRAVLAGLDIIEAIQSYRWEIRNRWHIDLDARVGINTGLVVVGAVGSDLRMEYTALGDAINLAARMEQTAEPGTVQVTAATHKLVAPLFEFETREGVEVKGRAEPVTVYRVRRQKAVPGSLRGIAGLHSPLVGRERELAALLAAAEELQQGRGQIVSVIAEAGLGKSRLVAELRAALLATPATPIQWLEGRSLSYDTARPYAPFIAMIGDCFGLRAGLGGPDTYRQLKGRLAALFPGEEDVIAPFFGAMLSLPLPTGDGERVKYLEPPMLRAALFAQVSRFVERMASDQPLVLFFDDLHWVDPTSLDLLESLLSLSERLPLLILAAYRPRRQELSWRFHEVVEREYGHRAAGLALQPLDQAQARMLVGNLLHVEDLPETVRALILEKAEGNPFFVEEVIRSLLDAGLVVREGDHWQATREIASISIPDTLVGVISARLDRLSESSRHIAQAAAVLGREFAFETLTDIVATPEALEPSLSDLQRRELVEEKRQLPRRQFAFKHVLTQEAAYGSMLLSRRRDLHRRAAESLERRESEQAAEISRHFLEARQPARAVPYLVTAGDQAARAYASTEAIDFYRRALEYQAAVEDLGVIQRAYEGLGSILSMGNRIPQALETYQDMLALGEARDNVSMQVSALNKLAAVTALRMGQFDQAEPYLARAERLARAGQESAGVAEAAIIRCQMCTAMADFDTVVKHMDEVVDIGQRLGIKEHMAMGLEHISSSLMFLTRFDEAWIKAQEALAAAREIGDREHEAWVLCTTLPMCLIREGKLDAARHSANEGLEIAIRIGSLSSQIYGNYLLSEIARWRGEYTQALTYGQRSLRAALPLEDFMPFMMVQPLGSLGSIYVEMSLRFIDQVSEFHRHALRLLETPAGVSGGGTAWADLGWCALTLGDSQLAEESFQKGLNTPTMFMLLERPRLLAGAALLASKRGRHEEARHRIEEAREYAAERTMRHIFPLITLTSAWIWAAQHAHDQALSEAKRAQAEADKLRMRPILWQAQLAESRALEALGRPGEAQQKRHSAQAIIEEIAALFEDEGLRHGFLSNALARLEEPVYWPFS